VYEWGCGQSPFAWILRNAKVAKRLRAEAIAAAKFQLEQQDQKQMAPIIAAELEQENRKR
jgi:hypothetical protein